jgi:hypothetical protein
VSDESRLSRSLWAVVLTIAVVVVVLSFARRPLIGGDVNANGFPPPLTLWVAAPEADSRTATLAAQAASCWGHDNGTTDVGILPGDSAAAVVEFMRHSRKRADDLLLVTSSTIATIVRDRDDSLLPAEVREHAIEAIHMLARVDPIAVLASDPLTLAVRKDSPIHSASDLLAYMRQAPLHPVFDVGNDPWATDNLAALVRRAGLTGEIPYGVFDSPREALASLDSSEGGVVMAPRSALGKELGKRLRTLPWPPSMSPSAWVAIVTGDGVPRSRVRALRAQTQRLCAGSGWAGVLRKDGLTPVAAGTVRLDSFLSNDIARASQLQTIASRTMRDAG